MEIKVFKDASKRDKTFIGLTGAQWVFILSLLLVIGLDIGNAVYLVLPVGVYRLFFFPLLALSACNAMYKPYGYAFSSWVKLFLKFQTTIQIRTYQKGERMRIYRAQDFKKGKKIKEATKKTKNSSR